MIKYFLSDGPDLRRATDDASGYDLRAMVATTRQLPPGQRWLVPTGLHLQMPTGVEGQIRSRSGLAIDWGVVVLNAPGTIDSDYRGEVKVSLMNHGNRPYDIIPGERIAQLVFAPIMRLFAHHSHRDSVLEPHLWEPKRVVAMSDLSLTARGASGHGSTGR